MASTAFMGRVRPGESLFLPVPPPWGGGIPWARVWWSAGVDDVPQNARIAWGAPGTWKFMPDPVAVPVGRRLGAEFHAGSEGISVVHRGAVDGTRASSRPIGILIEAEAAPEQGEGQPGQRAISEAGAHFITRFEGFSSRLYNDPAGHCTIGFGHLVHRGPCNGTEPAEFRAGITRERALALLKADAAIAADEVNRRVVVPLNQQQFDSLVSFSFNVGTGAFRDSTLLRKLNAGDYGSVPSELMRWVYAKGVREQGLVNRRRAEGALFRDGTY